MQPAKNKNLFFKLPFLIIVICLSITACQALTADLQEDHSPTATEIYTDSPPPSVLMPVTNTPPVIGISPTPISTKTSSPIFSEFSTTYTFQIVNTYPHDPSAFTQGLLYEDGFLYESTGRHGQSSLRKVVLETGEIFHQIDISEEYFAEGLTLYENRLYQITWQENTGFIYDKDSFVLLDSFSYPNEGWGLAAINESLIMSDGTNIIHFLDPETLQETRMIKVLDSYGHPLEKINELEFISGYIFANIWQTDRIGIINPENGSLMSEIDLSGLSDYCPYYSEDIDVLNGIAYDMENQRLFVTGKLWPCLFEIKLIPK